MPNFCHFFSKIDSCRDNDLYYLGFLSNRSMYRPISNLFEFCLNFAIIYLLNGLFERQE